LKEDLAAAEAKLATNDAELEETHEELSQHAAYTLMSYKEEIESWFL
jgi:hypothetical protein